MATLKQIEEFLGSGSLAMAGVSRNPKKFGFTAFRELREKGMDLLPVNPFADKIHGQEVFQSVASLPDSVKGLIILTKKDKTAEVIREAKAKGIRQIWIQQSSDNREAIKELEGYDANVITGQCILMHFKPDGIHKFHRRLKKFFGRFPG